MSRPDILSKIDAVEREVTASWSLPTDIARCNGLSAGPSGHQVAEQCIDCQRRTAPRAEARVWMEPPQQMPCPMKIGPERSSRVDEPK